VKFTLSISLTSKRVAGCLENPENSRTDIEPALFFFPSA
jgi:hypothetical protein